MDRQPNERPLRADANTPLTKQMIQEANRTMVERIMQMPVAPYEDGKYVLRVVETSGRKSGKVCQSPLAISQHAGMRYLISPERSRDWVLNLIAKGECVITTHHQQEHCHAVLAFDAAALAAVRVYIGQLAGWSSQQFPFSITESDTEIQIKAEQFAIFRLSC